MSRPIHSLGEKVRFFFTNHASTILGVRDQARSHIRRLIHYKGSVRLDCATVSEGRTGGGRKHLKQSFVSEFSHSFPSNTLLVVNCFHEGLKELKRPGMNEMVLA